MNRKLILRNMRRQLRRTVLTALTIALATFVFVLLLAVPASMDRIIEQASTTLRVVINNRTGPWYDLPPKYCDQVARLPGVTACVAMTGWPTIYQNERDVIQTFAAGPDQPSLCHQQTGRNRGRVAHAEISLEGW